MILRYLFFLMVSLLACSSSAKKATSDFSNQGREVPVFNADSAFLFIEKQLENGPRVPNTEAHRLTKEFLTEKLKEYAGASMVFTQNFEAEGYNETLKLSNIIAAFNPEAGDRIMLAAHWDSRPRADQDTERKEEAIAGADDGASGAGVILELARIFSENELPVGVDIVLFDGEDYGREGDLDRYFMGSRYWAQNPPVAGYRPRFGILLDMVGAKTAAFPKEANSMVYAPGLMDELWEIAAQKGYKNLFLNQKGGGVMDDHYVVARITGIPVIDIINHSTDERGHTVFPEHWHTHRDNIDIISRNTLKAVGSVLLELIYNRI